MSQLEQQLHRRNLETAWLIAAGWKPEHQEQLAELVVEEFIKEKCSPMGSDREIHAGQSVVRELCPVERHTQA